MLQVTSGLADPWGLSLAGEERRAGVRTSSRALLTARGLNLDPPGNVDCNVTTKEMVYIWSLLKTMGLLPCKSKYFVNEETACFGVPFKWTLLGAGNQARARSTFLFPAENDLSVQRKVSEGNINGHSDGLGAVYRLKIKMICCKGWDPKQMK